MDKGLLIVLSGPSGAGKGTIYNKVLALRPQIRKSVSVTTRAPRPNEQEGVHYYFRTIEQYQQMIAAGAFLETASVYNNYYGTPKAAVFDMLRAGEDVMFEIDTVGNKQIRTKYPECVSIFIMTPSFSVLEQRLRDRHTETEDAVKTRLGNARRELGEYKDFDYIVFNEDADKAAAEVVSIIDAEKSRMSRRKALVQELLKSK
mgnify:CR=1 FL=1